MAGQHLHNWEQSNGKHSSLGKFPFLRIDDNNLLYVVYFDQQKGKTWEKHVTQKCWFPPKPCEI